VDLDELGAVRDFGLGFRLPGGGPIPYFLPREAKFARDTMRFSGVG
jgi:hypothetical protein